MVSPRRKSDQGIGYINVGNTVWEAMSGPAQYLASPSRAAPQQLASSSRSMLSAPGIQMQYYPSTYGKPPRGAMSYYTTLAAEPMPSPPFLPTPPIPSPLSLYQRFANMIINGLRVQFSSMRVHSSLCMQQNYNFLLYAIVHVAFFFALQTYSVLSCTLSTATDPSSQGSPACRCSRRANDERTVRRACAQRGLSNRMQSSQAREPDHAPFLYNAHHRRSRLQYSILCECFYWPRLRIPR